MYELDLANHPGFLFVLATLLPLASFVLLLILGGLRFAFRQSEEGSTGHAFYNILGGDNPVRWPAYVATLAIFLAFVCSITGFVIFSQESSRMHELEEKIH